MNAGEETVCGLTAPPLWIVNVAGTRTFVEPPAGAWERVRVFDLLDAVDVDDRAVVVMPLRPEVVAVVRVLAAPVELAVVAGVEEVAGVELLAECEAPPQAATNTRIDRWASASTIRLTR
ncbi:MAG: hypothetical protein WBP81_25675 [Solirubrobacteraceae bacterium]